ncbi:MAG: endonuclease/exonuclease/phosphatase family protein [Bacteroidota bacterium]
MKKLFLLTFLCLLVFFSCSTPEKDMSLDVISFNIRFNNPGDGINRWDNRKNMVAEYLQEQSADVIGMQEVLHNQITDLEKMLENYDYVGKGRDDGKSKGEYSPIFYQTENLSLLDYSQFWLSETPQETASIGWDAAITRIATWAHFQHKETGNDFYVFNTHFDHRGNVARQKSPGVIAKMITEIAGGKPVIVTGDFNIRKDAEYAGLDLYENLQNVFKEQAGLVNSQYISSAELPLYTSTFNGYQPDWEERATENPIDHIYVSKHWNVDQYRIDHQVKDSIFISDHWPVVVSVNLNK